MLFHTLGRLAVAWMCVVHANLSADCFAQDPSLPATFNPSQSAGQVNEAADPQNADHKSVVFKARIACQGRFADSLQTHIVEKTDWIHAAQTRLLPLKQMNNELVFHNDPLKRRPLTFEIGAWTEIKFRIDRDRSTASLVQLLASTGRYVMDGWLAPADVPVNEFLVRENRPASKTTVENQAINPAMQWTGPDSKVMEPAFIRVAGNQQWQEVWLRHLGKTANQAFNDSDMQVAVDFSNFEVVAIFLGDSWNSRGVRLLETAEIEGGIRIRFEDISYQTSGIDGGGVKVSPYAFVVLPKTNKPIRLQENTQGLKNGAAEWTQRAMLEAK